MKEYCSTERFKILCQKYPSIGIRPVELRENENFFDLNAFGNKISIAKVKSPELLLWLAEAIGLKEEIIVSEVSYEKGKKDDNKFWKLIYERLNVIFDDDKSVSDE